MFLYINEICSYYYRNFIIYTNLSLISFLSNISIIPFCCGLSSNSCAYVFHHTCSTCIDLCHFHYICIHAWFCHDLSGISCHTLHNWFWTFQSSKKINQNIFTRMHTILHVKNSVIINSFACMLSFHLTIFGEFFNHMETLCMCATIWANPMIMSSTIGNMKVVGRRLLKCLLTCSTSLDIRHVCKSDVCENQHNKIHDS